MANLILEAPVFTLEAAEKAVEYGIDRIELCSDFGEGGETPSAGALSYLKERYNIPVFVMIRPRGGDFVYTPTELEVMKNDIHILRFFGADGFVFGILKPDGEVDAEACKALIKEAEGLPCTFHRAFDVCLDQEAALEVLIDCGFKRILTSGGENTVTAGLPNILKLLTLAGDRIIIMPGGGLQPPHVSLLNKDNLLREIHASCKDYRSSENRFEHPKVRLSNDPDGFKRVLTIDKELVDQFRKEMKKR
jgi:copper homeostasis protein